MYKKFFLVSLFLLFPLVAIANTHKSETININSRSNDINIKSGSNNIQLYDNGMVDQGTKDIISSEYNFQGNLINCTIGKSSKRRDLPSCNEVIEKRFKEEERMRRVEEKRFERQRQEQERSNKLFAKKKSITKSFTFPDGSKINTVTQIRFNPETSEIIVNSEVLRQSGEIEDFMKIFIEGNSKLEIAFFDKGKPVEESKVKHRAIDDVKPGGLGTFFIQEIMDSIKFKEGDKPWINNLVLTKKL